MDIVGAAARRGEKDVGGHSLEFENSVYVRLVEPVCMNRFDGNSVNSFTCHPSMHAPSLARVVDGECDGVGVMVSGERVWKRVVARCNSFCSCMLFSQDSRASRVL